MSTAPPPDPVPAEPADPVACAGGVAMRSHDGLADLPDRIVFFDGVCVFCDRSIRWLMERDRRGRLHFAPLQGPTAARVRSRFPDRFPSELDTLVLLENSASGPRLHLRSEAIFAVLREIEGPARRWAVLALLPRWLTDLGYRAFVALRYRLFGRLDACRVPTPEERARCLD